MADEEDNVVAFPVAPRRTALGDGSTMEIDDDCQWEDEHGRTWYKYACCYTVPDTEVAHLPPGEQHTQKYVLEFFALNDAHAALHVQAMNAGVILEGQVVAEELVDEDDAPA